MVAVKLPFLRAEPITRSSRKITRWKNEGDKRWDQRKKQSQQRVHASLFTTACKWVWPVRISKWQENLIKEVLNHHHSCPIGGEEVNSSIWGQAWIKQAPVISRENPEFQERKEAGFTWRICLAELSWSWRWERRKDAWSPKSQLYLSIRLSLLTYLCMVHACMHICASMWTSGCLPLSLSSLVFEMRSLTEPGTQYLNRSGWPVSPWNLPVSAWIHPGVGL